MRQPNGTLIIQISSSINTDITGSLTTASRSTTDENQTEYSLFPTTLNDPPIITRPINDVSNPQITSYSAIDNIVDPFYYAYRQPDGSVGIEAGSNITLQVAATQPQVLNIENGVPTILPPTAALTFNWYKDTVLITPQSNKLIGLNATLVQKDYIDNQTGYSVSSLEILGIRPSNGGVYTCIISNDVGSTTSDAVQITVYDTLSDPYFLSNLIKNPNGAEGINNWNASSPDLVVKKLEKSSRTEEFIKPQTQIFGYTVDMFHPRPYQLDDTDLKQESLTNTFITSDISKAPTYFSRSNYKYEKKGGTSVVRAYQDIDMTPAQMYIKSGVYGISGLRAIFSCYLGTAIPKYNFISKLIQDPNLKTTTDSYDQSHPRTSWQNFIKAGPAVTISEFVYVTIQEYENEKPINNAIKIIDPWMARINNSPNTSYPTTPPHTTVDIRDKILHTADALYPNPRVRPNYCQHAEFNRFVINQLNSKTTKIRVVMNFVTTDSKITEPWYEGYSQSDETLEYISWDRTGNPATTWGDAYSGDFVIPTARVNIGSDPDTTYESLGIGQAVVPIYKPNLGERLGRAIMPKQLVTGMSLVTIPNYLFKQDITDKYTNKLFSNNNAPASIISSPLTS